MSAKKTPALVAALALSALPLASCAMPGSVEAKKILSQQEKTSGQRTSSNAAPAASADVDAQEGLTTVSVEADPDGSAMVMSAQNAAIKRGSGGAWTMTLTGVQPDMARLGKGLGTSTPTAAFVKSPASLNVAFMTVNGIVTGKDGTGRDAAYLVAVQAPTATMRGTAVAFPAFAATQGKISETLLTSAQQRKDTAGNAAVNSLPADAPAVNLTETRLYLDTEGVKAIGNCLLTPATKCVGVNGDLYRSTLTGMDLSGSDFTGSNLSSSTMRGTNFTAANFTGAQLFRSDASKAVWAKAKLVKANSHQVTYTGGNLTGVDATSAEMFRSDFDKAVANGAVFAGTGLQQVTMRGASAVGGDFDKANVFRGELSRSNFTGSTFNRANLAQAIAMNTQFNKIKAMDADMSAIDARGADFTGAVLSDVQFSKATLKGTNFSGADLRGANLFQADINDAVFTGAKTDGMTCPNGDIIGKTITRKGWRNRWSSGSTRRLKQCRPVYREVQNTTAENSGTVGR